MLAQFVQALAKYIPNAVHALIFTVPAIMLYVRQSEKMSCFVYPS